MKYLKITIIFLLQAALLRAGTPKSSSEKTISSRRIYLDEFFETFQPTEQLKHLDRMWKYGLYPFMHREQKVAQFYKKQRIRRILYLSAGAHIKAVDLYKLSRLGIHEAWATDLCCEKKIENKGRFYKAYMDNLKPFPFLPNSFDLIVMVSGLCLCNKTEPLQTCCGIRSSVSEMSLFFGRILRVVNSKNPNAMILLEGGGEFSVGDEILTNSAETALAKVKNSFIFKLVKNENDLTSGIIFFRDQTKESVF